MRSIDKSKLGSISAFNYDSCKINNFLFKIKFKLAERLKFINVSNMNYLFSWFISSIYKIN